MLAQVRQMSLGIRKTKSLLAAEVFWADTKFGIQQIMPKGVPAPECTEWLHNTRTQEME